MARRRSRGSPFGEASRVELLDQHFTEFGGITPATAWRFVYEEPLWFDKSTGLVHLYESDKVRPGRSSWCQRSIVFTDRLASIFVVGRTGLKERIDRLFLACLRRLVESREETATILAVAEEGDESGLPDEVMEEAEE